eukprot:5726797-Amphidinium_carterae.2
MLMRLADCQLKQRTDANIPAPCFFLLGNKHSVWDALRPGQVIFDRNVIPPGARAAMTENYRSFCDRPSLPRSSQRSGVRATKAELEVKRQDVSSCKWCGCVRVHACMRACVRAC